MPSRFRQFYHSKVWLKARRIALMRAGYRCQPEHGGCGQPVHSRNSAMVDHIKRIEDAPALVLEPSNLRVLCAACHNKRHARDRSPPENQGARLDGWPSSPMHPWNRAE